MGHHIDEQGRFQSDKHPELPPDRIRLSLEAPLSVRALLTLADDYEEKDPGLAADLRKRLAEIHGDVATPRRCDECGGPREVDGKPVSIEGDGRMLCARCQPDPEEEADDMAEFQRVLRESQKRVQPLVDRLKRAERWTPEMEAFRFGSPGTSNAEHVRDVLTAGLERELNGPPEDAADAVLSAAHRSCHHEHRKGKAQPPCVACLRAAMVSRG